MSQQPRHPTNLELQGLMDGSLDRAMADRVSRHLNECLACVREIERFDLQKGTLLASLREPAVAFQFVGERQFAQVQSNVCKVASDASVSYSLESLAGDTVSVNASEQDTGLRRDDRGQFKDKHDLSGLLRPPEREDELGRIGSYRVLKVIGVGGMGMVLRGEDSNIGRQVAIKLVKREISANTNSRARFLREARAAAAINHPNIVDIYLVGEDRGTHFIVMPLLAGESLKTRLKRFGKLEQSEVLRIGRETAAGLAAAHEAGLIHRDVKPDNLWIDTERQRIKILDFGLARAGDDDAGLTQSGTVLGTPKYMAPEQANGEAVDYRCDLFSLGSVLYHLCSGQVPFQGKSLPAILVAVAQAEAKPIEDVALGIDPAFASLINALLSRDPNRRPQSAQAVVDQIQAIEEERNRTPLPSADQHGKHPFTVGKRATGRFIATTAIGVLAIVASAVFMRPWLSSPRTNIRNEENLPIAEAAVMKPVRDLGATDSRTFNTEDVRSDRDAAKWARNRGAFISITHVVNYEGRRQFFGPNESLPDGAWYLNGINLQNPKGVFNDDSLSQLSGLNQLTLVRLADCQLSGEGLVHLSESPLQELCIRRPKRVGLSAKGFQTIAQFERLTHLAISQQTVSISHLEMLLPLKNLDRLSLYYCKLDGEKAMELLKQFPKLSKLNLSGVKLSATAINSLSQLQSLRELILNVDMLTVKALDAIGSAKKLCVLTLDGTVVDEATVHSVSSKLPKCTIQYTMEGNHQRDVMRAGKKVN